MFEQSILPAPLTPPDCDLSGTHWMPLHGYRLFKSDFYLRATDQVKVVAQELWWASWVQVPAASIPDDDQVIASLAGFSRDPKGWLKIREKVLHGFVKCSDGRLYHSFLAGEAIKAYESRLKSDAKREADRARLQAWRDARRKPADNADSAGNAVENGSETVPETPSETRFVGGRQNLTRLNQTDKEEIVGRANALALQKRGTRLPPADDAGFEQFWAAYPKKAGKGDARNAWKKALSKASLEQILKALAAQRFSPEERYQPHPATWLNGERWLDEGSTGDPVLRAAGLLDGGK